MLFSSVPFLYYFLPCVLILYLIAPKKLKNPVLLVSSLIFYAWGEPKYVFLMAFTILTGYIFGLLTEKFREKAAAKVFTAAAVVIELALLVFFKYTDFFIANFSAATGLSIPLLKIALPVGISFYTFQILSYNVDVYRGTTPAQKNPVTLATYVTMFPQLIAGPIVRYTDVEKQLVNRSHSFDMTAYGIRRFILGLSKKILIANVMGQLCDIFTASSQPSVLFHWLYAAAFTLQIYFDFSGYSDMAIGLGKIFGFTFMENFNYPYISASITEFWRRWHISLSTFFRDYVYIPLGGNRKGTARWLVNILIVWLLTGFWHGAEWNFMAWGVYFGILLVIEKLWLLKNLEKAKVLGHIYTVLLVVIGFVIFNAPSLKDAFFTIGGMFGAGNIPFSGTEFAYYLRSFAPVIILAAVGATPLPKLILSRVHSTKAGERIINVLEPIFITLLLLVCTAYLVDGSFNPFLYFRF